jgi:hypothetical protein
LSRSALVAPTAFGPPQCGIDGLTLPWSAGLSRINAKSL